MNGLAALLLGVVPYAPVIEERCETLEINHYYNEVGKLVFVQLVFWCPHYSHDQPVVEGWKMWTNHSLLVRPTAIYYDGHQRIRVVRGKILKRTWTQHDPELHDKQRHPKNRRKGIGQ